MRTLAVLAILALAAAAAAPHYPEGDRVFLTRNRDILQLFVKVQQPSIIPEHAELMKSFKWEELKGRFKDTEAAERFMDMYQHNAFLPRNEDFACLYTKQFLQVLSMIKVLHGATDFDTFYKIAVWMRYHMNEGMYTYALTIVLLHRDDTKDMMLPPPYEVTPQFFVSSEVMQRAYDACLRGLCSDGQHPYIISANYTGVPVAHNVEAKLSYFMEDVGLSSFYALSAMQQFSWLNSSDSHQSVLEHRGEFYYFFLRNLLARYDLERYSNYMPPVEPVDVWEPITEGYDPKLRLLSGRDAAARPEGLRPTRTDVTSVEDYLAWERRVRDAASTELFLKDKKMKGIDEEGAVNTLGIIVFGGANSPAPNYYGSVAWGLQALYGHIADPLHKYGVAPSALEMHLTMLRDPLYYRISKRLFGIFQVYKENLPPYRKQDMAWPGVKIENLKIDKLLTYFDEFDLSLDNAIDVPSIAEIEKVHVTARQHRLNHKPFSYSLKVSSDKAQTALLRVYLGPHADWSGSSWRQQFLMIDAYHLKLKPGENTIVRNSDAFLGIGHEPLTFHEMYRRLEAALADKEKLLVREEKTRHEGYPHRLLLPRGRPSGLPLTVFAIVTESKAPAWEGQVFSDGHDPFFPFDRKFIRWELEALPNAHFEDVTVFHRRDEAVSAAES